MKKNKQGGLRMEKDDLIAWAFVVGYYFFLLGVLATSFRLTSGSWPQQWDWAWLSITAFVLYGLFIQIGKL